MITFQVWMYSKKYEIISLENCLDASIPDANAKTLKRVSLWPCHGLGGNQKWHYSSVSNDNIHVSIFNTDSHI